MSNENCCRFLIFAALSIPFTTTPLLAEPKSCTYTCSQIDEAELVSYSWVLENECLSCTCPSPNAGNCNQIDSGYPAAPVGATFQVACDCIPASIPISPDPTPAPSQTPTPIPSPPPITVYEATACTYSCVRIDGAESIEGYEWTLNSGCSKCDCPAPFANNCNQQDGSYPARSVGSQFTVSCQCPYLKEAPTPTPVPTPITCDCDSDAARSEKGNIALAVKYAVKEVPAATNRTFNGDLGNILGSLSGDDNFCYTINGDVLKAATRTLKYWYPYGLKCYQFGSYFNSTTVAGNELYGHNQIIRCPLGVTDPSKCRCYDPWAEGNGDEVNCSGASSETQLNFEPGLVCRIPASTAKLR